MTNMLTNNTVKIFALSLSLVALSSCVLNTANVKPSPDEYSNLIDTPVYVKKARDTDVIDYQNELDQCRSASGIKANRMSKVGIGLGSYFALGGLYIIATASGVFAPLYVAAGTVGGVLGGSTILVTTATEDYREYQSLEKCLEDKGHDVIFYDATNAEN